MRRSFQPPLLSDSTSAIYLNRPNVQQSSLFQINFNHTSSSNDQNEKLKEINHQQLIQLQNAENKEKQQQIIISRQAEEISMFKKKLENQDETLKKIEEEKNRVANQNIIRM